MKTTNPGRPEDGQQTVIFRLATGAVLRGRVVDDDGDPFAGAIVAVRDSKSKRDIGTRRPVPSDSAAMTVSNRLITDDHGLFEVSALPIHKPVSVQVLDENGLILPFKTSIVFDRDSLHELNFEVERAAIIECELRLPDDDAPFEEAQAHYDLFTTRGRTRYRGVFVVEDGTRFRIVKIAPSREYVLKCVVAREGQEEPERSRAHPGNSCFLRRPQESSV